METMRAIQWIEETTTETEAWRVLNAMLAQDGALCGEVIPPAPSKPAWRARSFMRDEMPAHIDRSKHGGVPDGMRIVLVRSDIASLPGMRRPPVRGDE